MASHDKVIRGDGDVSLDGKKNAETYDAMAPNYDEQLWNWAYEAPEQAAKLLAKYLPDLKTATILDCGCGTGMTGAALRKVGAGGVITGLDMSEASLEVARTKGVYDRLEAADLNQPLAFEDDGIDGVLCVGVLSYVREEPLWREWKRVIRPGGVVVFTSRDDFFESRGYADTLARLEAEGGWTMEHVSDPMPYLADHPEFAEDIQVVYCVCRVG
ncbi:MAG: class I SAM-dependent methyltransferase [Proteobacteria bacterium]|nr:class I SAM-dependent methyltransferase [Pseudomonadota bacterium]